MVSVGTIVWLGSELMFFAGLFAMYFTIRSLEPELWAEQTANAQRPVRLGQQPGPGRLLGVVPARRVQGRGREAARAPGSVWQIKEWGMREWYVLTYIFGAFFIAGQVYEYAELASEGVTLSSDRYGSVFYLTTGFHGLHVTGGLIAFLLIIGRTFTTRRYTHAQATGAVVTSYYWHFVDVVWIALFATIYLLK